MSEMFMWTVVQMSIYCLKLLLCYSAFSCMCPTWGPVWGLGGCLPPTSVLKAFGILFRVRSTTQLRIKPKGSYKMFWGPFLSPLSSLDWLPVFFLPGPLLVCLHCIHVLSLPLLPNANGRRIEGKNEDFPPWSLDHTVSLIREKDSPPFKSLPRCHCCPTIWLQLQEWGLLAIKLREQEKRP